MIFDIIDAKEEAMKKLLEKYRKNRSNKEVNLKAYTSDEIKQTIANDVKKLREELKMSRTELLSMSVCTDRRFLKSNLVT